MCRVKSSHGRHEKKAIVPHGCKLAEVIEEAGSLGPFDLLIDVFPPSPTLQ